MGILDLKRAQFSESVVKQRIKPYTLEEAQEYFRNSVEEHSKTSAGKHPWIRQRGGKGADNWVLEVDLYRMPLYWFMEEISGNHTLYQPAKNLPAGADPDEAKEVYKTTIQYRGASYYPVASEKEGREILKKLADSTNYEGNDPEFEVILGRAAEALKEVHNKELPDINKQAEYLWTYQGKNSEHGAWGASARSMSVEAKRKRNNAKNTLKQLARRQLGYQRIGVKVVKTW